MTVHPHMGSLSCRFGRLEGLQLSTRQWFLQSQNLKQFLHASLYSYLAICALYPHQYAYVFFQTAGATWARGVSTQLGTIAIGVTATLSTSFRSNHIFSLLHTTSDCESMALHATRSGSTFSLIVIDPTVNTTTHTSKLSCDWIAAHRHHTLTYIYIHPCMCTDMWIWMSDFETS